MSILNTLFGIGKSIEGITVLDVPNFKKSISGDVQLVDVRTPREFQAGTIKGAVNIDYFNQQAFKEKFSKLNFSKPVYIFCRSGQRSGQAAKTLKKMGFINIFDLKGGYTAWNR